MRDKGPIIGGIVTGALSLGILWLVGRMGAWEARQLLQSTLPTVRFLCSTTAAAAATILALMLTLLSLSEAPEEHEFHTHHFDRIRRISLYSTICLTASIFVLLLLVVPLEESEKVPTESYTILYYVVLATASMLGGLIVAIMLMLYNAITGLIHLVHPEADSHIVRTPDSDSEDATEDAEEAVDGGEPRPAEAT